MLSPFIFQVYTILVLFIPGCESHMTKQSPLVTLRIDHYQRPCVGVDIQLCLWVSKNGAAPEYFYDTIESFDYKWGYTYEITAEQKKISRPAADGASITYRLKEIIKKEKFPADSSFALPLTINGQPLIKIINEQCSYAGIIPVNRTVFSFAALQSARIGVFRHRPDGKGIVLVNLH
jgi:hypothetical protein